MRTGDLARARSRSKPRANFLSFSLVMAPIAASAIVAVLIASRIAGGEETAQTPQVPSRLEESAGGVPPKVQAQAARTVYPDLRASGSVSSQDSNTSAWASAPAAAGDSTAAISASQAGSADPDTAASLPDEVQDVEPRQSTAMGTQDAELTEPDSPDRSGLIDINAASLEQLNALGAGRVGRAIIRGRPYASIEDLVTKRVLSRSDFGLIRDQVTVATDAME